MPRLSKNNKYAILWLNSQGLSHESISKELNVTLKQIAEIISSSAQKPEQKPSTSVRQTSKDFMIRHSQNNVNSVSIMTQQASMLNDEARKNYPKNSSTPPHIHKIS
jgi:orotate phosphoribosyltransferase-like protein